MDDTPAQGTTPLWSDDDIWTRVNQVTFDVFHKNRMVSVMDGATVESLLIDMLTERVRLIAEADKLRAELAESQAYALQLERALGEAVPDVVLEGIEYMAATYWLAHTGPNDTYRLVAKWLNSQRRTSTSSSPTAGE